MKRLLSCLTVLLSWGTFALILGLAGYEISVTVVAAFLALFTLSGINFLTWNIVGALRLISDTLMRRGYLPSPRHHGPHSVALPEVAAIVPAHNEEVVIEKTLTALKRVLPADQIYVGSDASTDRTVELVQQAGCQVLDIQPNRGKAGVIAHLLEHFHLYERYKAVLIVDADTQVDADLLTHMLPQLDDPDIVAVGAHGETRWDPHVWPQYRMFFTAYRTRLYSLVQACFRYSQTWKYTNVTPIVAGFLALYRTETLRQVDICVHGLVIEDFNITFEVQRKRLGKIAYVPRAFGTSQDPTNLREYIGQVKRWSLGFWQTVRRHGFWPSAFWAALSVYMVEMIFQAVFFLCLPVILLGFVFTGFDPLLLPLPASFPYEVSVTFMDVVIGVFAADYVMTSVVAIYKRQPLMSFYGLFFLPLRYIDGWLSLRELWHAFSAKSDGTWVSPTRRAI